MKVMKNLIRCTTILLLSATIFSCSDGEDGAVGPQGEQGIQGDPGQPGNDGAQGAQGDQGDPGTANVIHSDWISNGFSTGGGLTQKFFTLATSQEINDLGINLNTSAVLIYGQGEDVFLAIGQEQAPLPYEDISTGHLYTYLIDDQRIRVRGIRNGAATNNFEVFEEYRYIIIPGGVAKSSIDHSTMSYEDIIALYNIPE